jgi:APA family basic amino acid/polyamine antiporter
LITVGAMVGSGIFATPHDVAQLETDPRRTLALWVIGGVLALLGALSFAELGAAIPETGGMYHYLRRAFGPFVAFTFAWAMLAVLVPSSVGYFAVVAARHLGEILALGAGGQRALAIGIIVVLVGVNVFGVRAGADVQNAATVIKYAGVVAVGAIGLYVSTRSDGAAPAMPHTAPNVLAALVPVLWAYDGWIDVTSVAGETRNPTRDIPFALVVGTLLVTLLYLFANVGYLGALGTRGLAASDVPAAEVAASVAGARGRVAASLLIAVATFGGCAVALLTGTRVVHALARSGGIFRALGHTSRSGAPDAALATTGALAIAFLGSRLGYLGEVFVVGAWPFYALGAIATIVLRRREPDLARPYRTLGYPYTIVAFALGSLAIVAGYAVAQPKQTLVSFGLIALGVPVYVARRRSRKVEQGRGE